ncbi:uncharacterized protein RSE6_03162 [Rhynchosporium secalis]|uniref:Uncharacterized protein n=1 Tax=Rhynchosporium secalis TaxID=38038 RepID=A0A1E1M264_RHYSE|nr:uncharacterized protein RSE6_03162 [Rhynchosporium secalis]
MASWLAGWLTGTCLLECPHNSQSPLNYPQHLPATPHTLIYKRRLKKPSLIPSVLTHVVARSPSSWPIKAIQPFPNPSVHLQAHRTSLISLNRPSSLRILPDTPPAQSDRKALPSSSTASYSILMHYYQTLAMSSYLYESTSQSTVASQASQCQNGKKTKGKAKTKSAAKSALSVH